MTAAKLTTAVPCWSSCINGICKLWTASSSIGKQSGALKSSRLMAENIGAMLK